MKLDLRNIDRISLLIAVLAAFAFIPLLGSVNLFDWDEVNFAEAAREMLVTDDYSFVQINFQPFWEKPPLFIWMQAVCMKVFGVNAFAARLPNAIAGITTLVLLFRIGSRIINPRFGLLWTLTFAGSMLPGFYFRSGIIDPWFNLFIYLGVHQLALGSHSFPMERKRILLSGLFIGLAVLTKGPVGLLLPLIAIVIYGLWHWKKVKVRWTDPLLFLFLVLLVGFSWFFAELLRGHGHVVQDFIAYNIRLATEGEAGHVQPFWYHSVVLLIGCFPISLFFLAGIRHSTSDSPALPYHRWMLILFWVVLIVFSIVKTKIVHYSSLTYFPLTFLAAWHIYRLQKGRWQFTRAHLIAFLTLTVLLGTAFTLGGMLNVLKPYLLPLLEKDIFAHTMFAKQVPERPWEPLIGLFFLAGGLFSLWMLRKGRSDTGIPLLFGTTFITVWLIGVVIAPKIEQYTQRDLVEFYRGKSTERCYLRPLHFHSYAHLFYGEARPDLGPQSREVNWLALESVDRPVYFIARNKDIGQVHRWFPHIQVTEERGPFVIMERTDPGYPFRKN
ncbi:MAG: glycosyltransferase family 39 protein [Flavobacteriales bacterium]|nr:glycosyltransferase family 39 protein [Flavobacteriales bacterium]